MLCYNNFDLGGLMIYSAIDAKREKYRTNLSEVFKAIKDKQKEYNFLITDCDCTSYDKFYNLINEDGYSFISGEELTKIIEEEEIQWIWGVFSAYKKEISLDMILKHPLPYADMNEYLWELPSKNQNPLSTFEIVAFDGTYTLIYSKQKELVDDFLMYFEESETLESYMKKIKE